MKVYSNDKRHPFYRITTAFFVAVLAFCSLGAGFLIAGADSLTTFTVTTTADSGAGSLRQAIMDANAMQPRGDFKIVIGVEGTLVTSSALPVLRIDGRSGWIQSNPNATITGFSSEISDGGHLTLHNVAIDNSAYDIEAVTVTYSISENTLLLSGSNRVIGSAAGYGQNIGMWGTLTIDKAPGGSDMDSTLILTDTDFAIRGSGPFRVKGGTIESHGRVDGIDAYGGVLVEGGKLIAMGGVYGIFANLKYQKGVVINGGTVVARANTDIIAIDFVIGGGSIDAKAITGGQPVDGIRNRVYLVTTTVGQTPVINTEVSCSVNGGTPFTCITDAVGKLYLWMPEGDGAAEINAGRTVYRASGSVAANYDNEMLALSEPVVTGVVVTPAYTTALTGGTVQYSARVEGLYNPPQTVTWSVENGHQGTSISSTGLLRIAPGERSTNLLVSAISTYDPSKSATAQVAVLSVIGIIVGLVLLFLLIVILAVFLEVRNPFRR